MGKLKNAWMRVGTTGTLDGTKVHKLVLEGCFGPVYNVTSTKKLIESKTLLKKLAEFELPLVVKGLNGRTEN